MNLAPSPALVQRAPMLPPPPSSRMLVDPEYLLEQLMAEATGQSPYRAQAGGPTGERPAVKGPTVQATGGFGSRQRQMNFQVVQLQGLMYSYRCSYVAQAIYQAYADASVDGILLEVNTGGGEVSAAQMINGAVTGGPKPVVTYAHYAASGGILGTSGSTEIVASGPMSTFGSIGVMQTMPRWMAKVYGEYFDEIYATTSPEKNEAWRKYIASLQTEAFVEKLNAIDTIFMEQVTRDRSLPKGELRDETLRGGTWLAQESKRRGLIDSIGNFNYAITRLASYVADNQYS